MSKLRLDIGCHGKGTMDFRKLKRKLDVIEVDYTLKPDARTSAGRIVNLIRVDGEFRVVFLLPSVKVLEYLTTTAELQSGLADKFPEEMRKLEAMEKEIRDVPFTDLVKKGKK